MAEQKSSSMIQLEMDNIRHKASGLREAREVVNAALERKKDEARELTRQINAIEAPIQELQLDFVRARKSEGHGVHSLAATLR